MTSIELSYHSHEDAQAIFLPTDLHRKQLGSGILTQSSETKTLLVMRHAKSSWKQENLSDFERPLNRRGQHAAPLMAHTLASRKLVPQLVLSSAAERARQTTDLLLSTWIPSSSKPNEITCHLDSALYLAGPRQYLQALSEHASDETCIMVVGHNPGLEYLVETLTGVDEIMPTAAVAIIQSVSSWTDLRGSELVDVLRPRELE